ncbi:MAG: 2-C-methyl-D-erythritol 4-phosphate cytidylyltransferase, partial [Desulfovibrio sp.]|nr:2-C-methyl-D-erythritol 4-phosphate cytidylyltransferase [Desulfovibrio sp.]
FERHSQIDAIVVVCLENWIAYLQTLLEQYHFKKVKWIIPGGNTGQESIRNGLMALWQDKAVPRDSIVLIHDGVRPLINADVISQNIACANEYGNAITVTPAIETIISVTPNDEVDNIYDRGRCRLARAPQTFRLSDIVAKHHKAIEDGNTEMIDSAMLMSHYGEKLHIVEGPPENIKITTPSDFYIFKAMYKTRENSEVWGVE